MEGYIISYINSLNLDIEIGDGYIDQLTIEINALISFINNILDKYTFIDIDGYIKLVLSDHKISCFYYPYFHNVYPYDYSPLKKFIPEKYISNKINNNITHINEYIKDSIYYSIHIFLVNSMIICKLYNVPLTRKQMTQSKSILFDNHYHSFPINNCNGIQIDI